jgi:hypothetical protein
MVKEYFTDEDANETEEDAVVAEAVAGAAAAAAPTAWTAVTFAGTWASQGVKQARGQVKATDTMAANATIFTLPSGFRPPVALSTLVGSTITAGPLGVLLTVSAAGVVSIDSAVIADDTASLLMEFSITA